MTSSGSRLPALRWAAAGVFILALLARLIALLRETLIAARFGLGAELDALYLGLALPMALTAGAGGGLSRAAVAVAAGLDRRGFAALAATGSRRLIALLLPASLLMALFAPIWVNLLRIGSESPSWGIVTVGAIMGSLLLLGGCLAGLYMGLSNAAARHQMGSIGPVAYNAIVCISIFLFSDALGVYSLGLGLLAAEWLQSLVYLPVVGPLLRARPRRGEGARLWKGLQALFLPSAIIGTSLGINVAIDRVFATTLDEGSIAALGFAERLINVPVGLVATALAVPLFTRLSLHHRQGNFRLERDTLLLGVRVILLTGVILAVYTAMLAPQIVGLLLERGKFGGEDVDLTSLAMVGYAAGVPFQAMTTLLTAAGLLGNRPWATVAIMLGGCLLNAILDAVMVGPLGVVGIALATSIVALVRVILLLLLLSPTSLLDRGLWRTILSCAGYLFFFIPICTVAMWFPSVDFESSILVRMMGLIQGVVAMSLTAMVIGPLLLLPEWDSLLRLRRRVAGGTTR